MSDARNLFLASLLITTCYNKCMKILYLTIFISFNLFAVTLPKHRCQKEAQELISKWKSSDFWSRRGESLFITPTKTFGEWIYFKLEGDNSLTLTKTSQAKEIRVNFNNECKSNLKLVEHKKNRKDILGDKKLAKLIKSQKGLIYIWSPNMPLSYKQLTYLESEAKKHKLKLLVFVDPRHNVTKKDVPVKYLNTLDALEFKHRNAYIHYPTVMAFEDGKIKNKIKYGYENRKGFANDIKNFFNL